MQFPIKNEVRVSVNWQNWEKQREIWDNTLTLWYKYWTRTLWRMLVLILIVILFVCSICEPSHPDFWFLYSLCCILKETTGQWKWICLKLALTHYWQHFLGVSEIYLYQTMWRSHSQRSGWCLVGCYWWSCIWLCHL